MAAHQVKFYFDYNSPYSYLASARIGPLCRETGAELLWMPFVIGGVFKEKGVTPPFQLPYRQEYQAQDLQDLAEYHQMSYRERTVFLFNPILSLRATLAAPQGEQRERAVHALFAGAFAQDLDLGQAEVVRALLDGAGLDGGALLERAGSQDIKDELRLITSEAAARGVFGAPTFIVDDEKMFWGQDRMDLLRWFLTRG
ncbi:MAG: 2-hydroxychromene-2-carboxylate isomerase [Deltaproteobacteria bacterium]|nr:2-hydroxychromene-2-carboxylate isomerase [Deltaproteobacteria bacterium]